MDNATSNASSSVGLFSD